MEETTSRRLKQIIRLSTPDRLHFIEEEIKRLGLNSERYDISPDQHCSLSVRFGNPKELWFTANYDTYQNYPSANNNASGVITLLGLIETLREKRKLPVDVRILFLGGGLDKKLVSEGNRDAQFIPGSALLLDYMIINEGEFIDRYAGTITIQAVGKGPLCIFERTGKRDYNTRELNAKIYAQAQETRTTIVLQDQSPLADNVSFLRTGLDATVLARYHEGAWHRMQTPKDDLTNVNPGTVEDTIGFIQGLISSYNPETLQK